jgi:hypothetical protein
MRWTPAMPAVAAAIARLGFPWRGAGDRRRRVDRVRSAVIVKIVNASRGQMNVAAPE